MTQSMQIASGDREKLVSVKSLLKLNRQKNTSASSYYKVAGTLYRQANLGAALNAIQIAEEIPLSEPEWQMSLKQRIRILRADILLAQGKPEPAWAEFTALGERRLNKLTPQEMGDHFLSGCRIALELDRLEDVSMLLMRARGHLDKVEQCVTASLRVVEARLMMRRGDLSRSYSLLVRAAGECMEPETLTDIRLTLAEVYLLAGDCSEAFVQLLHAGRLAMRSRSMRDMLNVMMLRAEALLHCGHLQDARRVIRNLNDNLVLCDVPKLEAKVKSLLALIALEEGRVKNAEKQLDAAHQIVHEVRSASVRRFVMFCTAIYQGLTQKIDYAGGSIAVPVTMSQLWRDARQSRNQLNMLFTGIFILRYAESVAAPPDRELCTNVKNWLRDQLPGELRPWLNRLEEGGDTHYAQLLRRGERVNPLARFSLPVQASCNNLEHMLQLRLLHARTDIEQLNGELGNVRRKCARLEDLMREAAHSDASYDQPVDEASGGREGIAGIDNGSRSRANYEDNMNHVLVESLQMYYPDLTTAELSIAVDIYNNLTTKEIASKRCLASRTIEKHRANIRRKMRLSRVDNLRKILANV